MNRKDICAYCQKAIINSKMKIGDHYKPVYCVAEREIVKNNEHKNSSLKDNLYHFRCYKNKNWDETDKLGEELIRLGNKR
jgi:hypothetical protein